VDVSSAKLGGGRVGCCYYTKRFAGLDPHPRATLPRLIQDTTAEFAAPFCSTWVDQHHCPLTRHWIPHWSLSKVNKCPDGEKDCVVIGDEYGIGHIRIRPSQPSRMKCGRRRSAETFVDLVRPVIWGRCDIKKDVLDQLFTNCFGDGTQIKFQPPILIDGAPSTPTVGLVASHPHLR
jgi:hypothetical protein